MRACILQRQAQIETRPLVVTEIPDPTVGDSEVLIQVRACGICRTDLHLAEGDLPLKITPVVLGHQVVGTVAATGANVSNLTKGMRVGVAWLHNTCGKCRYCRTGRENLCESAAFTGWNRHGGFADLMTASADFVYPIPENFGDAEAAPLLCAGIIGYRALRLTGIDNWSGARLGIYGFGAAGHVCLQIARHRGASVYVATRDRERHQKLAEELGASWVGDTYERPPVSLDAAIIFAPAGEIVPHALSCLDKGGKLVLGGIHMSPIPQFNYSIIYGERSIQSVANNTREDGNAFIREAADIPIRTTRTEFGLNEVNDALIALKSDLIKGAGVIRLR